MTDDKNIDRQPNWKPEQMETDDGDREDDLHRDEISGGLRGGGGPEWNKGSMEFDRQPKIPPSEMEESEEGPWGSADQAERARHDEEEQGQ
jgi:hypothetical protein